MNDSHFPRPPVESTRKLRAAREARDRHTRRRGAVKFNLDIAADRVPELWRSVVARVLETGCALGTRVDLPA